MSGPERPPSQAGLKVGDVVTAIDGTTVTEASALGSAIDAKRPGDTVSITYLRAGKTHTAEVKLAARPCRRGCQATTRYTWNTSAYSRFTLIPCVRATFRMYSGSA